VQGAYGTAGLIAGLDPVQRELAVRGRGATRMADRLGASKDEIDAVNAQLGVLGREFSDFVLAAAARDESLPFSLQFWDPTGGLDARIHRVTDIASLVDDDEYNHWGDWTDTALKSQLYGALQYGARLLTDDPSLVLADEVDSSCFRNFVDRRNKYNLSGYDWTIWFGWIPCRSLHGIALAWCPGAFWGSTRLESICIS